MRHGKTLLISVSISLSILLLVVAAWFGLKSLDKREIDSYAVEYALTSTGPLQSTSWTEAPPGKRGDPVFEVPKIGPLTSPFSKEVVIGAGQTAFVTVQPEVGHKATCTIIRDPGLKGQKTLVTEESSEAGEAVSCSATMPSEEHMDR